MLYLQLYLIVGLLLWFCVNLINGTTPKMAELIMFTLIWPVFIYWACKKDTH